MQNNLIWKSPDSSFDLTEVEENVERDSKKIGRELKIIKMKLLNPRGQSLKLVAIVFDSQH